MTTSLERERIDGAGLSDLVRGLFARAGVIRAPRPSGDDPTSRIRRAYWDLLALSERAGPGWRAPAQTPREHRAALEGPAWDRADTIVSTFERTRYGRGAAASDADEAERALRDVAVAVSATA